VTAALEPDSRDLADTETEIAAVAASGTLLLVPVHELLSLWSELEQAWHGTNGYGGHVAEIYAYRLWPYSPTAVAPLPADTSLKRGALYEQERIAAACLHALLSEFARRRHCRIEVDGRPLGPWLQGERLAHRAHVGVIHAEDHACHDGHGRGK